MEISPGNLIDQLSIINIKIFMLEDVKREIGASDSVVAEATHKTNILNSQRNNLISAIDEAFNKASKGESIYISGQNTKVHAPVFSK